MITKKQLRHGALQLRRALSSSEVTELSRKVLENIDNLKEFREANTVASYVALKDEVQTVPILQRAISLGKRVAVPRVEREGRTIRFLEVGSLGELAPGHFGVLEPTRSEDEREVRLSDTDIVLVPLVACDVRGHRIGYGLGYFDRALANRGDSIAIGLAFESQFVPQVPSGASDVRLDMIVTEKRVLRFGRLQREGASSR